MKKKQNILFLIRLFFIITILFIEVLKSSAQTNPFLKDSRAYTNPFSPDKKTVLIVFDASGSMYDEINGESKIYIAKKVLEKVLTEVDVGINVGLRVYGSSPISDMNPQKNCSDTKLLVEPSTNNRRSIISAVENITPNGLTPITYSLVQAIMDLAPYKGERSIVLISDGVETCGYDPCILAAKMKNYGINIKIDVVGFGINESDYDAIGQLNCVALNTHGKFFVADTAAKLAKGLSDSFSTQVSGKIITMITAPPVQAPTNTKTDLKNIPQIQSEKIDTKKLR